MLTIFQIARVCHEVNRAYCIAIGDNSQPVWHDIPEWQLTSTLKGIEAIMEGKVKNPGDSHMSWMAEKIATGWHYGEVKDPDKKLHPCIAPFKDLPLEQQIKDHLFIATAKSLLKIV